MNDVAEILLALFVSWENLCILFRRYATPGNACSQIWTVVEPTLAAHNRDFARNIELPRKSKEDCPADAKLREQSNQAVDDSFDRDVDELDLDDCFADDEVDEESYRLQDFFCWQRLLVPGSRSGR